MLSPRERIMKIADKWAYKFLCTAMTKKDIADFHWDVEIGNVYYLDVMDFMNNYEAEWLDGRWVVLRNLEEVR